MIGIGYFIGVLIIDIAIKSFDIPKFEDREYDLEFDK